jgi:hypothetical protein
MTGRPGARMAAPRTTAVPGIPARGSQGHPPQWYRAPGAL